MTLKPCKLHVNLTTEIISHKPSTSQTESSMFLASIKSSLKTSYLRQLLLKTILHMVAKVAELLARNNSYQEYAFIPEKSNFSSPMWKVPDSNDCSMRELVCHPKAR